MAIIQRVFHRSSGNVRQNGQQTDSMFQTINQNSLMRLCLHTGITFT